MKLLFTCCCCLFAYELLSSWCHISVYPSFSSLKLFSVHIRAPSLFSFHIFFLIFKVKISSHSLVRPISLPANKMANCPLGCFAHYDRSACMHHHSYANCSYLNHYHQPLWSFCRSSTSHHYSLACSTHDFMLFAFLGWLGACSFVSFRWWPFISCVIHKPPLLLFSFIFLFIFLFILLALTALTLPVSNYMTFQAKTKRKIIKK